MAFDRFVVCCAGAIVGTTPFSKKRKKFLHVTAIVDNLVENMSHKSTGTKRIGQYNVTGIQYIRLNRGFIRSQRTPMNMTKPFFFLLFVSFSFTTFSTFCVFGWGCRFDQQRHFLQQTFPIFAKQNLYQINNSTPENLVFASVRWVPIKESTVRSRRIHRFKVFI